MCQPSCYTTSSLEVFQIPALKDNYVYILRDLIDQITIVVDPLEDCLVLDFLEQHSWKLDYILNTHHHWDHVGGNRELKRKTNCKIIGSKDDQSRIPEIDLRLSNNESFKLGSLEFRAIATPGHTIGHMVYWMDRENALFCGDTLFSLSCGRLFEGTAEQMWSSLKILRNLPDATNVFCAHEYTQNNFEFAKQFEVDNQELVQKGAWIQERRSRSLPTVPFDLGLEKQINPFLRADQEPLKQAIGLVGTKSAVVFAKLRKLKDDF